jgi:glucose/arabinose dehydrogenase
VVGSGFHAKNAKMRRSKICHEDILIHPEHLVYTNEMNFKSFPLACSCFLIATLFAAQCNNPETATATDIGGSTPDRKDSPKVAPDLSKLLEGQEAFGDWKSDDPGVRRLIKPEDLPAPFATPSVNNSPQVVARPDGAWPKAPAGFKVELYQSHMRNPREIITAPNGDLFVAESGPGRIRILRGRNADGHPETDSVFATGLEQPFGLAFYPPGPNPEWLYVGNTGAVVRFPYHNGDLKATGAPTTLVTVPSGGRLTGGGHWTRDVRFSPDGKTMFVSVGSATNVYDRGPAAEVRRADILAFDPEGKNERTYASGIRNAVGLAIQPKTGSLWASVNERDGLGDNLPPDYITRVKEGQFYGWPWYYIGSHQDPRHKGEREDLRGHVDVPEVLLQAHYASLCITFYTGATFPKQYQGMAFAAEHGSWNREKRSGYSVICVPIKNGAPTGEFDDFLTGFVTEGGDVWGRPVGVTVAQDGALMVTDDGSNSVWRVQKE